ncbi:MAG: hypothetical protein KGP08_10845, partial [Xanthomonadaceae bacterium]|nr:hypothetical protein [Xanthomonadaceae bacterium]MDE1961220.1 hypothetical protein [Xanthomonadaceae bacterium]
KAEIPDVRTLNAEVDPELERILARMVAKDPAERYQSCQELVADLGRHPLVAKGGPITLQTRMSTAAATMVGQKTPVSGQRPLPSTSPTPQPLPVSRPTTPAAAQPVMGAHQPVLQPQPTAKSSPMLPLAIAAILILGLAGGAWAFRDRIPVLQQLLGAGATAQNSPAAPAQTAPVASPAVQAPPTAANAAPTSSTADLKASTDPRYAEAAPANSPTAIPPTPAPPSNASVPAPVSATAATSSPAQPVQVALATQPPKVSAPPKPHVPVVVVLASGDEAISGPAEAAIERTLERNGYRVSDQDSMPRVDHLLRGERPRFAEALAVLHGHADAVVFVHARKVGAQELTYYGQSSTLYTAELGVRAYAVEGRRPLGPPWNEQVNFTSLNASQKAHEAVAPMLERVSERLVDYKPGKRRE